MVLQYAAHNTKHIQLAVRSDLSCFLFLTTPIVKASRKLRRTRRREKTKTAKEAEHTSHIPYPYQNAKIPFNIPLTPPLLSLGGLLSLSRLALRSRLSTSSASLSSLSLFFNSSFSALLFLRSSSSSGVRVGGLSLLRLSLRCVVLLLESLGRSLGCGWFEYVGGGRSVADLERVGLEGFGSEGLASGSFSREVLLRRLVSERLSFGRSVSDLRDLGRSFFAALASVTVRELRFLRSFSLSFSLGGSITPFDVLALTSLSLLFLSGLEAVSLLFVLDLL